MELKLASFELANKLKELGFDEPTGIAYYNPKTKRLAISSLWIKGDPLCICAPTLELAAKWIRKNFNYDLSTIVHRVYLGEDLSKSHFAWIGTWTYLDPNDYSCHQDANKFDDRDDAFEYILNKFCDKMLKEKSENKK